MKDAIRAIIEAAISDAVAEVLTEAAGETSNDAPTSETTPGVMVGKYCIVRCKDAGVHAGLVVAHQGREATLMDSRRLWYWKPADGKKFLSGVAVAGLDESSKVGATLPLLHLTETCELIECTADAEVSIRGAKADER
jgi:hypothetical protein